MTTPRDPFSIMLGVARQHLAQVCITSGYAADDVVVTGASLLPVQEGDHVPEHLVLSGLWLLHCYGVARPGSELAAQNVGALQASLPLPLGVEDPSEALAALVQVVASAASPDGVPLLDLLGARRDSQGDTGAPARPHLELVQDYDLDEPAQTA